MAEETRRMKTNRPEHQAPAATKSYDGQALLTTSHRVVGGLFSDADIVDVTLPHAGGGHPHETGPGAHQVDAVAAGVAHGRAQAAHHLVDDDGYRALVGHAALDALGNQFFRALGGVLEVTVAGAH